jgi:hypothetical protein
MERSKATKGETPDPLVLGEKGEKCAECGTPLAPDQRYCLKCGRRRAGPRVDFEQHLGSSGEASADGRAPAAAPARQWSPLVAAAVLGLLGIMLLVGVLIGKEDNDDEQAAPATATGTAPAQAVTPTTAAPPAATTTAPATPPATPPTGVAPATPGAGAGAGAGAQPPVGTAPEAEVPPAGNPRGTK